MLLKDVIAARREVMSLREQLNKTKDEIVRLKEIIRKALPHVSAQLLLTDALDRHAPLPPEEQKKVEPLLNDIIELQEEMIRVCGIDKDEEVL